MLNPNDKVVCIDDVMNDLDASCFSERLVKGRVYLVREFLPASDEGEEAGLLLAGITGEIHVISDEEFSFRLSRFRKLGEANATTVRANHNEVTL